MAELIVPSGMTRILILKRNSNPKPWDLQSTGLLVASSQDEIVRVCHQILIFSIGTVWRDYAFMSKYHIPIMCPSIRMKPSPINGDLLVFQGWFGGLMFGVCDVSSLHYLAFYGLFWGIHLYSMILRTGNQIFCHVTIFRSVLTVVFRPTKPANGLI